MRAMLLCAAVTMIVGCGGSTVTDDAFVALDAGVDASRDAFVGGDAPAQPDAFTPPDAFASTDAFTMPDTAATDAGADAGRDASADVGADTAADAAVGHWGTVLIESLDGPTPMYFLGGIFGSANVDTYDDVRHVSCTVLASEGACELLSCTASPAGDDAGTLSATVGGAPFVDGLTLGGAPSYHDTYVATGNGAGFAPGDTIAFHATGAMVPAFDLSVVGPAPCDAVLPATHPRSDLTVTWTPSTADHVSVRTHVGTNGNAIDCEATGADGSVVIPISLVEMAGTSSSLTVEITTLNILRMDAGDYHLFGGAGSLRRSAITLQ